MKLEDQTEPGGAEELFDAVFSQDAIGMVLRSVDPVSSRWLRVNQKFCDMLGYTREELLQLTPVDISLPEERHLAIDYNELLLRGDLRSYTRDKRYLRKDGTVIWTNIWLSAVLDSAGEPTQIISVIQDITEEKRTQEALETSETLLAQSAAMANLGCAVWDYDSEKYITVSEEYAGVYGYTKEEYLATFNDVEKDHEQVHPEDRERYRVYYKDAGPSNPSPDIEYRVVRRDGEIRHLRQTRKYVFDASGERPQSLLSIQDITEYKLAVETLRESEERFSQLGRRLDPGNSSSTGPHPHFRKSGLRRHSWLRFSQRAPGHGSLRTPPRTA